MIKVLYKNSNVFICLIISVMLLSSCNTTKYLAADEALLKETKIVFKNEKNIRDKKSLEQELSTFINIQPNDKFLMFFPKEYIYMANFGANKDEWYHKAMRSFGEPPHLFKESESKAIALKMENHLKFKKGYYDAKVDFLADEKIRGFTSNVKNDVWFTTEVTYVVSTGERYKIKDITYNALDKEILNFIQSKNNYAYIHKGDFVDFNLFELEKSRLTIELQNSGYTNFSNNYFEISGDSSHINKEIDIFIEVRSPLPDTLHPRFTTGKINVYTDYYKNQPIDVLKKDSLFNTNYFRQSTSFLVKPSLLHNSIFLKEGKLLSREDKQKTFRKLNGLGTYRFVTINPVVDVGRDSILNFDVLLTPFDKKWIWDGVLQGYFITLGAAQLFGISASSQFVNRNLLGGSEKYSLRAEAGTELGLGAGTGLVRRTTNLSLQNNLNIPSFQDFLGFGKILNRVGVIKDKFYKSFVEDASTNISLGFSANTIIDFYSISSYIASYGFDYTSSKNNRYIFRPLGFNLDLYEIKDESKFQAIPNVKLSFQDILGTGFIFRDFSYIYNRAKSKSGNSLLVINNLELSGWEVHLTNFLYNQVSGRNDVWKVNEISFAKYARYEFDGRLTKEYSKTRSLAFRVNVGAIVPFGEIKASPFVRQFSVGGPNSLRAWNLRQLGPGSYRDPLEKLVTGQTIFVNQGDLKLELNAEYRFKIAGFFDGAFFVDAGNVWALRNEASRPGAAFSKNFVNELAIGAGYGIRLNFDFFLIRFDFGYKLRNPYFDEFKQTNWYTFREVRQQGLGNLQVGVNFPF